MSRHPWTYKNLEDGYMLIVCPECGREDLLSQNEIAIKARLAELRRAQNAKQPLGLGRRMRKARAAGRGRAG